MGSDPDLSCFLIQLRLVRSDRIPNGLRFIIRSGQVSGVGDLELLIILLFAFLLLRLRMARAVDIFASLSIRDAFVIVLLLGVRLDNGKGPFCL